MLSLGQQCHMEARRFPWGATIIFAIVLVITGAFAWKVFSFYRQIRSGTMDPGTYALSRAGATESALASLVAQAKGSGTLATDDDPSLGGSEASVTIVEFADFGCPYSKAESLVVRALAQQFPNDVRVIFRDYPLEDLHPGAELAAAAGTCADAQRSFWEFHDKMFAAPAITEDAVLGIADELGLDVDEFVRCSNDPATTEEFEQDLADGYAAGVAGTPTFFVNGEKIEGAVPYELLKKIIEAFIAR